MDTRRQRDLFEMGLELMDLDGDARNARLELLKTEDPSLYNQVIGLFREDKATVVSPNAEELVPSFLPDDLEPGKLLGPYKLNRVLGEGGMGRVFLATQESPIKRTVALKVIKGGHFGTEARSRFEMERKTLAMMDHPAIAVAYEAGASGSGYPYIAMEYVDGEPIDQYCENKRLTLEARIKLFLRVAEGVQHAHQRGIIHRDIKPSNVLIKETQEGPQPKIIDFGIAKAFEGDLADQQTLTLQSSVIGSWDYMSPEQLKGKPIDIRTDVFALSMVLYKILAGTLPFENPIKKASNPFFERVSEHEKGFSRPSTRLIRKPNQAKLVAANRRIPRKTLLKQLKYELDWVILKGLEENRDHRFPSVNELIAELGRYLRNEPLWVRPPSLIYKIHKFARRNKAATIAGLVSAMAVMGGTVLAVIGLVEARAAQQKAHLEATKALAINQFLEEMLWSPDPHKGGKDIKVRDVLDQAAAKLDSSFQEQPEVRIALYTTIGKTFHQVGDNARALVILEEAVRQSKRELGETHLETIEAEVEMAETSGNLGNYEKAQSHNQQIIEKMERLGLIKDQLYFQALNNLAVAQFNLGDFDEAGRNMNLCYEGRKEVFGKDHPRTLGAQGNLIVLMGYGSQNKKVLSLAWDLYETKKRVIGEKDPSTLHSLETLAYLERKYGSIAKGTELNYQHYQTCLEVFGEDHLRTLNGWYLYCRDLFRERRYLEAESQARQIVEAYEKFPNNQTYHRISALEFWADSVYELGGYEEAKKLYERLLSRTSSNEYGYRADAIIGLARSLAALGQLREAIQTVEDFFQLPTDSSEPAQEIAQHYQNKARAYLDWDLSKAELNARLALEAAKDRDQREDAQFLLGDILYEAGKYDAALPFIEAVRGDDTNTDPLLEMDYGLCLNALGRDGNRFLERAASMARKTHSRFDGNLATILRANGMAQAGLGNRDQAKLLLKEARQIFEHTKGSKSEEVRALDRKLAELVP